jgi:hypothetical protein
VANLYSNTTNFNGYKLSDGLIGNNGDIVCTAHPIWCNNGSARILPQDIDGCEKVTMFGTLYDVQFEDEGTFYVNGIKVDSLPPNNSSCKLSKELFYDETKFVEGLMIDDEDAESRCKPHMVTSADNFCHC